MEDGGSLHPQCDHCITKIIHTKRVVGLSAKAIHEYLKASNIIVSYRSVLTAFKRDQLEEIGDKKQYRFGLPVLLE